MKHSTLMRFEECLGVLVFVANANKPVSVSDLIESVTNLSRCRLNYLLPQFVAGGYLTRINHGTSYLYEPTGKTRELFGVADLDLSYYMGLEVVA